jgi:hypothetical protein
MDWLERRELITLLGGATLKRDERDRVFWELLAKVGDGVKG